MCPYVNMAAATAEGYYSSNLECVRKDVECTFGITKKRWKILNNGLMYHNIKVCEKIFVTCACLHNMLVKDMKMNHSDTRVGRVASLGKDGIYLDELWPISKTFPGFASRFRMIGTMLD